MCLLSSTKTFRTPNLEPFLYPTLSVLQISSTVPSGKRFLHWPGSLGHAIPKYATLLYWLYWAEGTWETANAGRAFWPPLFYFKTGHNIAHEKRALLVPGRKNHPYHQRLKWMLKWICTNFIRKPYFPLVFCIYLLVTHLHYFCP